MNIKVHSKLSQINSLISITINPEQVTSKKEALVSKENKNRSIDDLLDDQKEKINQY